MNLNVYVGLQKVLDLFNLLRVKISSLNIPILLSSTYLLPTLQKLHGIPSICLSHMSLDVSSVMYSFSYVQLDIKSQPSMLARFCGWQVVVLFCNNDFQLPQAPAHVRFNFGGRDGSK